MTAPASGTTCTGMVKSYNKKGFGFIMVFGQNSPDVFYTRENVSSRLMHPDMPGEQVSFELFRERGKLVAKNIRPLGDDQSKGGNKGMVGRPPEHRNPMDDGQWKCPFCGEHNFARRMECFKCKIAKPQGTPVAGFSDAPTNIVTPPPPKRTFSPHAGARAIKLAMAGGAGGGVGGGADKSDKSSSSSPRRPAKRRPKKRRKSSSSSSSSSDKSKKKKGRDKKRSRGRSSSSSGAKKKKSRSRSSSSGVVVEGSSSGNPEIDKAKADALQQLTRLQSVEPKEVRMSEFRALLRQWHPDKNPERVEMATAVFQFLQKGKALMRL